MREKHQIHGDRFVFFVVVVFFLWKNQREKERESEPGGQRAEAVTKTVSETERQREKILRWPQCSMGFSAPSCGKTQTFWPPQHVLTSCGLPF